MEKAEEDAVALEVAMITKTRSIARLCEERLRAAAAESRVERLEAIVQHGREQLEGAYEAHDLREESLHEEILDREDDLALAKER